MTATLPDERRKRRDSHIWARDPHDFYVEPEWCSERLFRIERFEGTIYDPACGLGRIVQSAFKSGFPAFGTDLVVRNPQLCRSAVDFLTLDMKAMNIISNPPFGIAEKFVEHALRLATRKVAMLLPSIWLQGDKRSRWLETTSLARVLLIAPRPSMPPGAVILAGEPVGGGTTDFSWYVWDRAHKGAPTVGWLRREP
jgi:hypothetical protein